jgi:hypothetical protein
MNIVFAREEIDGGAPEVSENISNFETVCCRVPCSLEKE